MEPSTSYRLSDFPQFTDYQKLMINWVTQSAETDVRHEICIFKELKEFFL